VKRSWNASVWWGFVLGLAGILSYPLLFIKFPATRDFPWVSLLMIVLGLVLLGVGIARAFRRPDAYRGKIFGSVLGVVLVAFVGFFAYGIFVAARQLPASPGAPQVGQIAPDFTLPDSKNNFVDLSGLLSSPFSPNGTVSSTTREGRTAAVLLIFYRGYW